jgi:hypothetical protein
MGLMDVLNGLKNGPRGQTGSSATTGGMSPLTMGLLALLAYKAEAASSAPPHPSPTQQDLRPLRITALAAQEIGWEAWAT